MNIDGRSVLGLCVCVILCFLPLLALAPSSLVKFDDFFWTRAASVQGATGDIFRLFHWLTIIQAWARESET